MVNDLSVTLDILIFCAISEGPALLVRITPVLTRYEVMPTPMIMRSMPKRVGIRLLQIFSLIDFLLVPQLQN